MKILFRASARPPLVWIVASTLALTVSLISLLCFAMPAGAIAYPPSTAGANSYRQNLPRLRSSEQTPEEAPSEKTEAPPETIIILEPLPPEPPSIEPRSIEPQAIEPQAIKLYIEEVYIEPVEEIAPTQETLPRDPYAIIADALQGQKLSDNPFHTLFAAGYPTLARPANQPQLRDRIARLYAQASNQPARLSRTFEQFKASSRRPLIATSPIQGIRQRFQQLQQQAKAKIVELLNRVGTTAHKTAQQIEITQNNIPSE